MVNKSEITIRIGCEVIVAYDSQQINTDKKPHKRWLLFQEYVYYNGIKINFEHIKGVKNVVADILSFSFCTDTTRWSLLRSLVKI